MVEKDRESNFGQPSFEELYEQMTPEQKALYHRVEAAKLSGQPIDFLEVVDDGSAPMSDQEFDEILLTFTEFGMKKDLKQDES